MGKNKKDTIIGCLVGLVGIAFGVVAIIVGQASAESDVIPAGICFLVTGVLAIFKSLSNDP